MQFIYRKRAASIDCTSIQFCRGHIINDVNRQRAVGLVTVFVRHHNRKSVSGRVALRRRCQFVAVINLALTRQRIVGECVYRQRAVDAREGLTRPCDRRAVQRNVLQAIDRRKGEAVAGHVRAVTCVATYVGQARFIHLRRRQLQYARHAAADGDHQISSGGIAITVFQRVVEGVGCIARCVRVTRIGVVAVRLDHQLAVVALNGDFAGIADCRRTEGACDCGYLRAREVSAQGVFASSRIGGACTRDHVAVFRCEAARRDAVCIVVRRGHVVNDLDG